MKAVAIGLIFFFAIWEPAQAQDHTYTLDEAISYAMENHNNIKAAILDIADAANNVKEYTAIGMPKVNGGIDLQHFIDIPTSILPRGSFFAGDPDQGIPPNPEEDLKVQFGVKNNITANLSADVLLFDGSFFVGLQAAKLFKKMVTQQTEITKDELAENVAKAYLGVLLANKNEDLINKNIANLQTTLNETEQIYEQGFVEKLDVDRLQLSLNNLRLEADKVRSIVEVNKNVLKFSIGLPFDQDISVSETLEDIMLTQYELLTLDQVQPVFENRPELAALYTAGELNDLQIKRLKYGYLPVLRAFGNYSQVLQGNEFLRGQWFPTTIVGLNLQIPIFDGFDKSSKIDRAEIARDKHLLTIDDTERAITLEVENAKIACKNALRTVESAEQSVDLSQNIYDTALIKYREGVGSSIEITQAESDLYAAQSRHINSIYQLLVANIDLEKALGNLLKQ
ncbi:MAG: TolC family protein [Saprospiraceae bacterium]|nr:TolC family protein [Saprospiraceae bacterium]